MWYLWIDLGNKRVWLSIGINNIAMPLYTVDRVKIINEIKKIIIDKWITTIVIWLPYDLYWKNTKQLDKTIKFKEKLTSIFPDIKIYWEDERFTSFASDQILWNLWKWSTTDRDSMSACLILESFLQRVDKMK